MPITYLPPSFNLTCNVWHAGTPLTDPPDFAPMCQLYFHSRADLALHRTNFDEWIPPIYLRCPIGTDLREGDIVECADSDGWFYIVRWVERVHRGFPNEYFLGMLAQIPDGPAPGILTSFVASAVGTGTNTLTLGMSGLLVDGFMLLDVADHRGAILAVSVDVNGVSFPIHINQKNGTQISVCHASNAFVNVPAGNTLTIVYDGTAENAVIISTILDSVSNPIPWRTTYQNASATNPFTAPVNTTPKTGCYIDAFAAYLTGPGSGPNFITPTGQTVESVLAGISGRGGFQAVYPAAPVAVSMDAATVSEWFTMLAAYR